MYSRDKKNIINRTFSLFCLCVSLWSFFYIFWPLARTKEGTLLSFRLLHLSTFYLSPLYLHFVSVFLGKFDKNKKFIYFGYIVATVFLFFSFSPIFIKDMVPKFSMHYWADIGILYNFYVAQLYGYMIYSNYLLFVEFRKSVGIKKSQIRYILIGIIILYISGGTNYALFYNINFPPYLNILSSGFVVATAYAIIRHRLMDIKFVLRRSSVYLVSILSIIIPAFITLYYSEKFLPDYLVLINLLILILGLSVFPPLRNFYYSQANKYFFTSLYDSSEVIASLSNKLRSTLDLKRIYQYIAETLSSAFHVKAIGILGFNEKNNYYYILFNNGFNTNGQNKFESNIDLHNLFIKQGESLIVEEAKRLNNRKHKPTLDLLTKLKVEVLTPLNLKDKTIGLIALGAKESKDIYNDEDLKVLKVVGAQAAIAIENALLYEETKNFSNKLKKEVDEATKDLQVANEQLRELDAAKSEFISIASHQLRTPLTIIKGYISMMLEGNFGKLTKNERGSLEKVFESNERLIHLVENLLNISRIESGRMKFSFENAQLDNIVTSVIEELSDYAKRKKLRLEYIEPKKTTPMVKIDEEKIRQVIINLIDNAIKYTKQGGITIKLEEIEKNIRFSISDSGVGIKSDDLPTLFKKFSRGKEVTLIHTEGTGLGLYVAKMMIEAHRGRIWAESKGEGKGSKFYFEIPILQ